jgi:muramoyltetrapeptide carboxypeptidase
MIDYWRSRLEVPLITGLPFGHGEVRATLAVGAPYRLRVEAGFALLERATRAR